MELEEEIQKKISELDALIRQLEREGQT